MSEERPDDVTMPTMEWTDLRARLNGLGYYRGETYYYDPNKPTLAWLQSDFAGSAFPVADEERLALLGLIDEHRCGALPPDAEDDDDDTSRATFWLIERGQSMGHVPTVWWRHTGSDWTTDVLTATRFATRDEANREIDGRSGLPIPSHGGPVGSRFGVAVEHTFLDVSPARADPEREG